MRLQLVSNLLAIIIANAMENLCYAKIVQKCKTWEKLLIFCWEIKLLNDENAGDAHIISLN